METINIAIIGAGIVGLSAAAKLSEREKGIYVFEKNKKFVKRQVVITAEYFTQVSITLRIHSKPDYA